MAKGVRSLRLQSGRKAPTTAAAAKSASVLDAGRRSPPPDDRGPIPDIPPVLETDPGTAGLSIGPLSRGPPARRKLGCQIEPGHQPQLVRRAGAGRRILRASPQTASDCDDRTTAAVNGAVPWVLLDNPKMRHVGAFDVDLNLEAEGLGDGENVGLVDARMGAGYEQRKYLRRFQLVRSVPAEVEATARQPETTYAGAPPLA